MAAHHNNNEYPIMSFSETTAYVVRAIALQNEERLEEEDRDVAGDHIVELPIAALDWEEGKQATEVLDTFHNTVPVGMLEDFEFSVIAPDGREIFED